LLGSVKKKNGQLKEVVVRLKKDQESANRPQEPKGVNARETIVTPWAGPSNPRKIEKPRKIRCGRGKQKKGEKKKTHPNTVQINSRKRDGETWGGRRGQLR